MRFPRVIVAVFLCVILVAGAVSSVRAEGNSEMVVKAVMIRKFIEFIAWPEAVAPQKDMQVRVCVYGDSEMSQMMPVFAKGASAASVKYSLSNLAQLSSAGNCHVLFIASSKQDQLSAILGELAGKPVLTVSDAASFVEKGGMIGFQIVSGKVRYNINNRAFGGSQLKVDAQLLEIANKVVE